MLWSVPCINCSCIRWYKICPSSFTSAVVELCVGLQGVRYIAQAIWGSAKSLQLCFEVKQVTHWSFLLYCSNAVSLFTLWSIIGMFFGVNIFDYKCSAIACCITISHNTAKSFWQPKTYSDIFSAINSAVMSTDRCFWGNIYFYDYGYEGTAWYMLRAGL